MSSVLVGILKGAGCLAAIVLTCGVLFASCLGIGYVGSHADLQGELAEIEAVRADALAVDPQQAEDVIGQVTELNRKIAENKANNKTWWYGWAIAEEWESVELIPVPQVVR